MSQGLSRSTCGSINIIKNTQLSNYMKSTHSRAAKNVTHLLKKTDMLKKSDMFKKTDLIFKCARSGIFDDVIKDA